MSVHPSIQAPVLDRFSDMMRSDCFISFNIRDRPCYFEDAVIRAGRQAQPVHGRLHQVRARLVDLAVLADMARLHLRVGIDAVVFEALVLDLPRARDPLADGGRWLSLRIR